CHVLANYLATSYLQPLIGSVRITQKILILEAQRSIKGESIPLSSHSPECLDDDEIRTKTVHLETLNLVEQLIPIRLPRQQDRTQQRRLYRLTNRKNLSLNPLPSTSNKS